MTHNDALTILRFEFSGVTSVTTSVSNMTTVIELVWQFFKWGFKPLRGMLCIWRSRSRLLRVCCPPLLNFMDIQIFQIKILIDLKVRYKNMFRIFRDSQCFSLCDKRNGRAGKHLMAERRPPKKCGLPWPRWLVSLNMRVTYCVCLKVRRQIICNLPWWQSSEPWAAMQ